ncbi:MAG: TIM44-like domain-containing protein, partial [Pseudomonadota bacterium]|nr:TIM44-like domain-containing protein [Pseudomonadota bacterium]
MRNEEDDNTGRHDAYRLNREAFDTAKDARKDTPKDSGKDTAPAGDAEPVGASETPRPFAEPMDDTPIEAGRGLTLVREKDPDFDEEAFVEGARKLYEMILLDFAAGDLTG